MCIIGIGASAKPLSEYPLNHLPGKALPGVEVGQNLESLALQGEATWTTISSDDLLAAPG